MNYTQRRALINRIEDAIYDTVAQEQGAEFAQTVLDELGSHVHAAVNFADVNHPQGSTKKSGRGE